nr:hypothetical protein [Tanacetum cinerariifolium]
MMARGVPNLAKRDFKSFKQLERRWWGALSFQPILTSNRQPRKCVPQSLMMARGVPNLAKRDFKSFQTTRASLVGSAFVSTHFDNVVRAIVSPGGSIVASLENVNGFLSVNTLPDDLIYTDFEQEGVIPKVMLHIFEEYVLLLGQHLFNNEFPCMEENPPEQSRLGIFLCKEIFKGEMIRYTMLLFMMRIFDELDNAYAKCFVDNQSLYAMNKRNIAKNTCLQIQKKNLLIHDESLIAYCIAQDSQLAIEESRVDESEIGNPRLDKPVLDKLEVGFDHD